MPDLARVGVTGLGVVTSIGHDVPSFIESLHEGRSGIARLTQIPTAGLEVTIGAEVRDHDWRAAMGRYPDFDASLAARSRKLLARVPNSIRLSAAAVAEALTQANLRTTGLAPERIGLIVAGSNLHQRYIHEARVRFEEEPAYVPPAYALHFSDVSQVGYLSELFGLRGMGYTAGGASASGNVALHQAGLWIRHGVMDACVVAGASADLSAVELQGFSILGAACSGPANDPPERACRPFDRDRQGFVFGEGSGCVVLENLDSARRRGAPVLGELRGSAMLLDANSHPNPSPAGEEKVIRLALAAAQSDPGEIGYVNAHGSSSTVGDEVESEALIRAFAGHLDQFAVNSTKSLTGHCLSSAGVIEFIATLAQLNQRFLHPNLNLSHPLTDRLRFAGARAEPLAAQTALSNGFGFGGINTCLVVGRGDV